MDKDKADPDSDEFSTSQDIVVTKYNMAAEIVNDVLKELISKCVVGQSVIELCEWGDKEVLERTSKVFKKEKEMKKGIAFPTCISINHCICHYSPLKSEPDVKLASGDVVKIDLGAHVDGFIAVAAHTVVVGATKENKVTGRKADVVLAAYNCLEVALRMLRPGQHKNVEVTEQIQKIAEMFACKPVENMLSFQLKRLQIGNEDDEDAKQIILNPSDEQRQKYKKCSFAAHEVYAIDILISTGEGKGREQETRTTVFKHKESVVYQLKMSASRTFFFEAKKKFANMPFSLRMFDDEKKAKMGVVECERHELMKPFKVYYERDGEFVAQFKATVLIMPSGLLKITGLPLDDELFQSEHSIKETAIKQLLAMSLKPPKKKKKAGAKAAGDGAGAEQVNAAPVQGDGERPDSPLPGAPAQEKQADAAREPLKQKQQKTASATKGSAKGSTKAPPPAANHK